MFRDPLTNQHFEPTRINQRFASAKNRIAYHNRNATIIRHRTADINKPIQRNLRILYELLPEGKVKKEIIFHKQYLLGKGFSFLVHTHIENISGKRQFAIYNYIVIPLENDQIKIILK